MTSPQDQCMGLFVDMMTKATGGVDVRPLICYLNGPTKNPLKEPFYIALAQRGIGDGWRELLPLSVSLLFITKLRDQLLLEDDDVSIWCPPTGRVLMHPVYSFGGLDPQLVTVIFGLRIDNLS